MSRPVSKFIRDMLFGICGTGSASVFNMAKLIQDNTTTKKTSERLYRNLGREGLDGQLQNALMDLVCPKIKADSLILVDERDIEKPYARKMEGCKKVHNGSKSAQTNGYNMLNIVACIEDSRGYKLLPVCSDLISTAIEVDTTGQILQDRLVDINIRSGGRGIFVFDRGYDDRKLLGFLVESGMSFIIRGMGTRNIREGEQEHNFQQAVGKMSFQYTMPGLKDGETLRCATRRIGIRTDDHPSRQANSVEASLVVVRRYKGNKRKGKDFYMICDFGNKDMPEVEIIHKAIDGYRKRWKIEEVHRQMKQDFQWKR